MRSMVWTTILLLSCSGCASLDYMGETFPPTSHVDVYYSETNVPREYHVMGELLATADLLVSTSKVQEKMVKKAQESGADAVVLLGLEHYQTGTTSNWEESSKEKQDKKGNVATNTAGTSTSSIEEKKKIRALFIKYKSADAAKARPDSVH